MKKILFSAAFFIIVSSSAFAVESTTQAISDANSMARAAQEFVMQAEKILETNPDRSKVELALSFYAKAGELFERSYKIYATLGPSYVSQQDIDGARAATQNCVNNINELRKRL